MRQTIVTYALIILTVIVGIGVFRYFYQFVFVDSMEGYEYNDKIIEAVELYKEKPVIYGTEKKIVIDIGSSKTELRQRLLENVTAKDYAGHEITERIIVYRLNQVNLKKRGNYVINYCVTDDEGITATMDRYVIVE